MTFGERGLILFAVLPLAIGGALLFSSERRFLARFTATGLEVATPRQAIPYASLLEVRPVAPPAAKLPVAFAIEVVHRTGNLLIPEALSVRSERVYAFLRSQLPQDLERALPAALADYRRDQEASFGPERVFCYGGRRSPTRQVDGRWRAVGLGALIAGAVWLAAAIFFSRDAGWAAASFLAGIIGFAILGITHQATRPRAPAAGGDAAGLVITPLGLALRQGTLNGHVTWKEIRKVGFGTPGALKIGGATDRGTQLILEVEGATIGINDVYDRPLSEIHERILSYW